MFSTLENVENLVLNLRPGSVYLKYSFRYGPSFSSLAKWPKSYSYCNPVALHGRAALCHTTLTRVWRGVAGESRYTPRKGPLTPTFSALEGGAALQVASWKASRYNGVSQLPCRLSRCSGALRQVVQLTEPKLQTTNNGPRSVSPFSIKRHGLSAPNHKSQIASDLKSRSPNRENFPQIAASNSSNRTFKSRDL